MSCDCGCNCDLSWQYQAWSQFFTSQLRSRLGPSAIILANSAGALSDPALNGLTIEMEACVDYVACMNAIGAWYPSQPPLPVWITPHAVSSIAGRMLVCTRACACACLREAEGQLAVAVPPAVGIMWLTHSEVMPGPEQCVRVAQLQATFPWLRAGTDFFDGSHVVCPSQ